MGSGQRLALLGILFLLGVLATWLLLGTSPPEREFIAEHAPTRAAADPRKEGEIRDPMEVSRPGEAVARRVLPSEVDAYEAQPAWIEVQVLLRGRPVPQATVSVDDSSPVHTDANGRVKFSLLELLANQIYTEWLSVQVSSGGLRGRARITPRPQLCRIELSEQYGVPIVGWLQDEDSRQSLAGYEVRCLHDQTHSDEQGRFELVGLDPGVHVLTVLHHGVELTRTEAVTGKEAIVRVPSGFPVHLTVVAANAFADADSDKAEFEAAPLQGEVLFWGQPGPGNGTWLGERVLDERGECHYESLPLGHEEYVVWVRVPGYLTQRVALLYRDGRPQTIELEPARPFVVAIPRTSGANARVHMAGTLKNGMTITETVEVDPLGHALFTQIPESGMFRLSVSCEAKIGVGSAVVCSQMLELTPTAPRRHTIDNLELFPVQFSLATGEPPAGAMYRLRLNLEHEFGPEIERACRGWHTNYGAQVWMRFVSDGAGRLLLHLPKSRFELGVEYLQGSRVDLGTRSVIEETLFTVPPMPSGLNTVLEFRQQGQALANRRLKLAPSARPGDSAFFVTDAGGRIEIPAMPEGEYVGSLEGIGGLIEGSRHTFTLSHERTHHQFEVLPPAVVDFIPVHIHEADDENAEIFVRPLGTRKGLYIERDGLPRSYIHDGLPIQGRHQLQLSPGTYEIRLRGGRRRNWEVAVNSGERHELHY